MDNKIFLEFHEYFSLFLYKTFFRFSFFLENPKRFNKTIIRLANVLDFPFDFPFENFLDFPFLGKISWMKIQFKRNQIKTWIIQKRTKIWNSKFGQCIQDCDNDIGLESIFLVIYAFKFQLDVFPFGLFRIFHDFLELFRDFFHLISGWRKPKKLFKLYWLIK